MLKRFFCLLLLLCAPAPFARAISAQHAFVSKEDVLPLVPQNYAFVDFDIQPRNVILLMENAEGTRCLRVLEYDGGVCSGSFITDALPQGAGLDTVHPADDSLQIEWREGEKSYCAEFSRCTDGRWALSWASDDTGVFPAFHATYDSIREDTLYAADAKAYYGNHPWNDLSKADFSAFPHTLSGALALLDQRASAVVHNPNPADRLHLRTEPKKSADSFGKFYNGTPVEVLDVQDNWAHVRIGLSGNLEGYMMTEYLAFGADGNDVAPAFPQLVPIDAYGLHGTLPALTDRPVGRICSYAQGGYRIIGVVGEKYFIILNEDGSCGYVWQDQFFEGNG